MRRFIVIAAVAGLAGCSASTDVPLATRAIEGFHQSVNAGRFDAIYDAAAPDMKRAATRDKLDNLLGAVHRKLGLFRSGAVQGWNDTVNTTGHFVQIAYAARYDRDAVTEQFIFRVDNGQARLVGYNINSTAMMVN